MQLSESSGLSIGSIQNIVHAELRMKNGCAQWVPHSLTDKQRREGVRCATELLKMFESRGPNRHAYVVTGDETWIILFVILSKQMNRAWIDEKGKRPLVLGPGSQKRKMLFTIKKLFHGAFVTGGLPNETATTVCKNG